MLTAPVSDAAAYRDRALASLGKLPPFSPVLNRLLATLADEDVSFRELGDLIEKDTVLAGNVLRLVNSALYGRRGTINSVRHAVSLMGLCKLRNTTLSLSMARLWNKAAWPKDFVPGAFNLHAVATAVLADQLAVELPVNYPEGAFTAGLLADVGLMLEALGLPTEFGRVRCHHLETGLPLAECERALLGLDHAELSGEVLARWNLPPPIQLAARSNHGPHSETAEGVTLGYVVDLAARAVEQLAIPVQPWCRPAQGDAAQTLAEAGLADQAERITGTFRTEFDALRTFFH